MERTCVSTVPSVNQSRFAIAAFVRPIDRQHVVRVACASAHECTLSRVSEEAARAASSALAMVDTAERLLDRDLEASDDAGVAASRE
jgi:hypothetical protein